MSDTTIPAIPSFTDPQLRSWVAVPSGSDFPLQNLPYGIFKTRYTKPRVGVAIGEHILDVEAVSHLGLLNEVTIHQPVFAAPQLNDLMALGKDAHRKLRAVLTDLLTEGNETLPPHAAGVLVPQAEAEMLLPVRVGDYTDFYSSLEHATNVGTMFRGADNALMPNWKHLPVGYHGRASSIIPSGVPVKRPYGQVVPKDATEPIFRPSQRMDFELEMAFVTCGDTPLGRRIAAEAAEEHIFGLLLFNDWSARDIQKWEYQPLGPFLGKSFASTVSPWVVPLEALEPFRVTSPMQDPAPLDYLKLAGAYTFDIDLEVAIAPRDAEETRVCLSNFKHLYWSMPQQLAHQTVNGCNIRTGDLYASGTISGTDKGSFGSMLELSWAGKNPVPLNGGHTRIFLHDHDTVILRGWCTREGFPRIGFGEARAELLPADE